MSKQMTSLQELAKACKGFTPTSSNKSKFAALKKEHDCIVPIRHNVHYLLEMQDKLKKVGAQDIAVAGINITFTFGGQPMIALPQGYSFFIIYHLV